ncbi:restriction endonuclease subunit S [Flavobacteriaceae bacterium]|nr:restriction endonuclease subunit S [Flavobacteriaceae bacterium]
MILKNLFKISKGKKAIESNDNNLQRYIQIGDLRSDDKIKYAEHDDKNVICNENDVLIAWDGANAGTIGYNLKGIIGSTLAKLSPKVDNIYSPYTGRFLQSQFRYLRETCTGATIPHISRPTLESLKIPLPPLDQQKKIAAILDLADSYRQKTKTLITKYDELTQSLFLDMFGDPVTNPKGWEKVKLGKISHMKAGKFVKASGIKSEKNSKLYSCYGGNGLRGYVESFTHEGEFLLIGRQGALCGNVKRVNGKFHATEHAIVCSPTMKYESLWLYHMLVMINLNKYATGAAQPGLNVGTLVDLEVMFASYNLQIQFAERVQAIEAQKAQAQASLAQAEDLFNSLLQRAFKGELTS